MKRLALVLLVSFAGSALLEPAAHAKPEWLEDFERKAQGWLDDLEAALDRLKRSAKDAGEKVARDVRARIDELVATLEAHRDALERMLAEQGDEYRLVLLLRLREAVAVAQSLESDLAEMIAGTRSHLSVEKSRLASGIRTTVEGTLAEASARLEAVDLVDDRVVAAVVEGTRDQAKRWAGFAGIALGVVVVAGALGLVWRRRRPGESAARVRVFTVIGVLVACVGVAVGVGGGWLALSGPETQPVVLGVTRCDALADAQAFINQFAGRAPAESAVQGRQIRARLTRCQLLAADTATATLVEHQLSQLDDKLEDNP